VQTVKVQFESASEQQEWAERAAKLAKLAENIDTAVQYLQLIAADARAALATTRAALAQAPPKPVPTTDEYIAEATSATAIYKAMEGELGVDRRTILARVERLVLSNGINKRMPDWSTNVKLARSLATRMPNGEFRLTAALRELAAKV
jgi:hypothetical protein